MATIAILYFRIGVLLAGAFFFLFVSGCATTTVDIPDAFPVLKDQPSIKTAEVDVLGVSREMKQFVSQYAGDHGNGLHKLRALIHAVNHPGLLGFEYDDRITLTAEEAFDRRIGNCLSFANLFIALAREAGLKAHYQEVKVAPQWNEREQTYLLARHINIVVTLHSGRYIVDVSRRKADPDSEARRISDKQAKAQYFNNLGADALFKKDLAQAYGYFVAALKIDPGSGYVWSNLGVAYNRNDQPVEAEWSYKRALAVDKKAFSAMGNLSAIYWEQGKIEQARLLKEKAESYRRSNPYYLLMLSERAVNDERYGESIKLLRSAIRKKNNEHRLHFAIARSFYLLGRYEKAQASFERARELAPGVVLKERYNRQLGELVESNI